MNHHHSDSHFIYFFEYYVSKLLVSYYCPQYQHMNSIPLFIEVFQMRNRLDNFLWKTQFPKNFDLFIFLARNIDGISNSI